MRIKVLQLDLTLPRELSLVDLRSWLVDQLRKHGEPLRWAITALDSPFRAESNRKLRVEVVLIVD